MDQHVGGGVQGPAAMCVSCRIQLHRAGTLHTHSLCVNLVKPDEVSQLTVIKILADKVSLFLNKIIHI